MALFCPFSRGLALPRRALLCVLPAFLFAQEFAFSPGPATPIGETLPKAFAVAVADLTNDGKPDVLIGTSAGLVLLTGAGDSQFQPGRQILAGCWVLSLAVADFDRDGKPDIAALCTGSDMVLILKNAGNGDFQEVSRLPVSSYQAHGVAVADFNRDGRLDLAVAQFNGVALFLGNGDCTFAIAGELASDGTAISVLAADFNADGIVDLAIANSLSSGVTIFLGSGGGRFQPALKLSYGPGGYVRELAAADLNNDGALDLAAAYDYGLVVWFGAGDGSFRLGPFVPVGNSPLSIAVTDLNGDRAKDVVLGNYYNGEISILTGKGDGTFTRTNVVAALGDVFAVAVADFNGDTKPDLVATSYSSSSALVALGRGDGAFEAPIYFGLTYSSFLRSTDLDGDGKTDLAVFVPYRKSTFFLRRGTGLMGAAGWGDYPVDAQFGDFNRDGLPDLIVTTVRALGGRQNVDLGATIWYLAGRGGGLFGQPLKVATPSYLVSTGAGPPLLATADFTGASKLGFVFANNATKTLQVFSGNGDGSFAQVAQASPIAANALVSADFDRDGTDDVAVASNGTGQNPDTVTVVFGGRGGKYPDPKSFATCNAPRFLLQGDFNGDSKPDLAAICGSPATVDQVAVYSSQITVLINAGGGAFRAAPGVTSVSGLTAVSVADFDGDGNDDLAISYWLNSAWGGGAILRGKSDGTFQPAVGLDLPADPIALLAQRWDDDGKPDLAVLSGLDATVRIMGSQGSSGSSGSVGLPQGRSWPWRNLEVK